MNTSTSRRYACGVSIRFAVLALLGLGWLGSPASAALVPLTTTWTGGAHVSSWTAAGNWDAMAPSSGRNIQFAGPSALNYNDIADLSIRSITFNAGAGAFSLEGNGLSLGFGGLTNNSSSLQTINFSSPLSLTSAQIWNANSGDLVVNSDVVNNGHGLIIVGSHDTTLSGVVSGSGGLTKLTGDGVLTLSGANTYSGGTSIDSGTVKISADNNLGAVSGALTLRGGSTLETAGAVVSSRTVSLGLGGGTFDSNGFDSALSGTIGGLGGLTKVGDGTLVLSGTNTYIGGTSINGGVLSVSSDKNLGSATPLGSTSFDGGTLLTSADVTSDRRVLLQSGGGTIDTAGNTATLNGVVSGVGRLTKAGDGTLALTGHNTYAGGTAINGGTLQVVDDTNLGASNGSVSMDGGTLQVVGPFMFNSSRQFALGTNGGTFSDDGDAILSGVVSGVGGLTKTGSGLTYLYGNNTYLGGTAINGGTLSIMSASNLGDPTGGLSFDGGTLQVFGNMTLDHHITLNQGGGEIDGGIVSLNGTITGVGGLTENSSGILTFNNSSDYAGATNINAGVFQAGAENVFSHQSAFVLKDNVGGNILDLNNFNQTIGSLAGGAGSGGFNGSVTLGSAILTTGSDNTSTTFSGVISDGGHGGGLVKVGTGTFTLAGHNTYTGATTISAGTLQTGIASALSSQTAVSLANGATFDLNGFSQSIGSLASVPGSTVNGSRVKLGNAALTTGNDNTDTTYQGIISGSGGSLIKVGSGTFTLAGNNTYSGGTTINGGTLRVMNDANLGASNGSVTMDGGTLQVADSNFLITSRQFALGSGGGTLLADNSIAILYGDVSGSGRLTVTGQGIVDLYGNNTYAGGTAINGGSLLVMNASNLGDPTGGLSFDGGALVVSEDTTLEQNITLNGDGGFIAPIGTVNLTGTITGAGGLTTAGGTLVMNNSSDYTGATTVEGGVLRAGAENVFSANSAFVLANGQNTTLDLNNYNQTIGSLAGGASNGSRHGVVSLGSAVLTTGGDNTSTEFDGVISGSGGLIKEGTGVFTLAGANTYSGGTTINAGTLQAGAENVLGTGAVTLANVSGANLDLNGYSQTIASLSGGGHNGGNVELNDGATLTTGDSTDTIYRGQISGDGSLVKQGDGTFTLTGNNSYTGGTTVNAGTLFVRSDSNLGAVSANDGDSFVADRVSNPTEGGITLNGGTLSIGWTREFDTNRAVTLGERNGTIEVAGYTSAYFGGAVNGGGRLTKTGDGLLNLSGENGYTGGTIIDAGTLQAGAENVLGTGGVTLADRRGATLDLNGYDQTIGSLSGGGWRGGRVELTDGATLTTGTDGTDTTFSGRITGSGGLTKVGDGTFRLLGNNSYTGGTEVDGGTLFVRSDSNLGDASGGLTLDGGTLSIGWTREFDTNRAVTLGERNGTIEVGDYTSAYFGGVISGDGSLTKTGDGLLNLSGENGYMGGTTVAGGTLLVRQDNNLGDASGGLTLAGGTLEIASRREFNTSRAVVLGSEDEAAGGTIQVDNRRTTANFDGVISGGSLTKTGSGTLVLSGANTYTGGTTIEVGTLQAGAENVLGTGGVTLADRRDTTLNLNGYDQTIGSLSGGGRRGGNVDLGDGSAVLTTGTDGTDTTFSGRISGSGSLVKTGAGIFTLAGANTYQGGTTVNGGTLRAGAENVLGAGQVALANGSILDLNNYNYTIDSLADDASGTQVTLGSATLTTGQDNTDSAYSGVISGSGSLVKIGSGTFTLAGANTYLGGTTINGGTLAIGNDNNLGDVSGNLSFDNGTLLTLAGISSARNVTLNAGGGTINTNSFDSTLSGVIGGVGSLTKSGAGTLTLLGDNTYAGGTILNGGTLAVGSAGAPAGGFSPFGFGAPAYRGIASHVLAMSGTPLGAGDFTLNDGTLKLAGQDFGTIRVNGNYTQTGGTLDLRIGGGADSGLYDVLSVGGVATLGGTLQLDLVGGALLTPGKGVSMDLIQASSILGSFNIITGSAGLLFSYNPTTGLVDVAQASYASLAATANQRSVGANLDLLTPFAATGDLHTLIGNLNNVLLPNLPAALNELSPQRYEMFTDVAFRTAAFTSQGLSERLARVRAGSTGLDMAGMLPHQANGPEALLADASMGRHASEQWDFPTTGLLASANGGQGGSAGSSYSISNNLGAFVSGNAIYGKLDATGDLQKSNFTTSGTMGGLDYRLSDNFVAGLLFSYAHTSAELDGEGSTSSIDAYSPGAYATYFDGPFHWDGMAAYSRNAYTSDRNIIFTGINRTAHGTTDGDQLSLDANTGYDFKVDHYRLGPTVGLEYVKLNVNGFTETGAGSADLLVKSQDADSLKSRIGTRIDRPFTAKGIGLDPEVRVAWQHEYMDDSRNISAQFADPNATSQFTVHTTDPQRDSALLGAGIKAQLTKNFDLYLDYNAQVGQKNFVAQGVQGGGRLRF